MNNLRPDFNITLAVAAGAAAHRRRERRARWDKALRKSLCALGFHPWMTLRKGKCKVWFTRLWWSTAVETPAEWRIERCPHCHKRRGFINNGFHEEEVSASYIESETA